MFQNTVLTILIVYGTYCMFSFVNGDDSDEGTTTLPRKNFKYPAGF